MVLNTLRAPNLQHMLCPLEYAHKLYFSTPPCMRRGQQLTSPVDSKQVQPKIDRWKRQTEAHWRFSALLNDDDVVRSISLPHSPLQKELEIVEVLRIGVGEDVDHKRLGPLLLLGLGGPKPLWGPTAFSYSVRLRRLLWLAAVASGYGGQGKPGKKQRQNQLQTTTQVSFATGAAVSGSHVILLWLKPTAWRESKRTLNSVPHRWPGALASHISKHDRC